MASERAFEGIVSFDVHVICGRHRNFDAAYDLVRQLDAWLSGSVVAEVPPLLSLSPSPVPLSLSCPSLPLSLSLIGKAFAQ